VPLSLHQYQHNAPLVSGREGSGVIDCYPFLKNTFLKENFFYFRAYDLFSATKDLFVFFISPKFLYIE
jgi:hypothetical protein